MNLKEIITSVLVERGEELLNDDGVDRNVAASIAESILSHVNLIDVEVGVLPKVIEALRSVSIDCQMALNGTWDKSDDGFQATLENVNDALEALGVEPPEEQDPEKED